MKTRQAARCLARQQRACHGPWDWCTIQPEERIPGPKDIDPTAPKYPFSRHNLNPENTVGGKPYATLADEIDYAEKFKKWLAEKKADPEYTFTDMNDDVIVRQPYHHPEEHAKFIEDFKLMPAEERLRLGHTVDEGRKKSHEELFPGRWSAPEEAAVYLNRDDAKLDHYYRFQSGIARVVKGDKWTTTDKGVRASFTEPVTDYMGELREALAQRDAPAKEAEAEAASA